jgi:plasmid maintenance system antidote protein VapI
MQTVSEKLKLLITVKEGLSVTDAAKKLEIGRPALSNVLNGNASLSIDLALKIENVFGLDARELLIKQVNEGLALSRKAAK